jgi:hypothetical protein
MVIFDEVNRCIGASADFAVLDKMILADARAAIERSLRILRESSPENHLGKNYYAPAIVPRAEIAVTHPGS